MTRDESIAFIEALDAYLEARATRSALAGLRGYKVASDREDDAREALIESLVPVVTGVAR